MRDFKDKNPNQRLQHAAQAKQALLQKVRANMPSADDPAVLERKAAQKAVAEAREAREAAKAIAKKERAAREAAEAIERTAAAEREAEAEVARRIALEAEQKAARDARYAARKGRK